MHYKDVLPVIDNGAVRGFWPKEMRIVDKKLGPKNILLATHLELVEIKISLRINRPFSHSGRYQYIKKLRGNLYDRQEAGGTCQVRYV